MLLSTFMQHFPSLVLLQNHDPGGMYLQVSVRKHKLYIGHHDSRIQR